MASSLGDAGGSGTEVGDGGIDAVVEAKSPDSDEPADEILSCQGQGEDVRESDTGDEDKDSVTHDCVAHDCDELSDAMTPSEIIRLNYELIFLVRWSCVGQCWCQIIHYQPSLLFCARPQICNGPLK